MTDDDLTPDQLAAAIQRLEAEKRRRAAGKPSAPVYPAVERTFADPDSNPIINSPAPPRAKPRKTKKPAAARLTPVPFYVFTTPKAVGDDPGAIAESYYVTRGRELALCDASGTPTEWHPISERGPLRTAQQLLKQRLAARRGPGPDHSPIRYKSTGDEDRAVIADLAAALRPMAEAPRDGTPIMLVLPDFRVSYGTWRPPNLEDGETIGAWITTPHDEEPTRDNFRFAPPQGEGAPLGWRALKVEQVAPAVSYEPEPHERARAREFAKLTSDEQLQALDREVALLQRYRLGSEDDA